MEIVDHQEIIVAGFSVRAPLLRLSEEVPKIWRQLFARAWEFGELHNPRFLDINLSVSDSEYLQLVGMQLPEEQAIPMGFDKVRIPAQKLLHHRHVGPVTGIGNSFGAMYVWAEEQGITLSEFKLDAGYTVTGGEAAHDLYLGLLPETSWDWLNVAESAV